MLFNSIQFGTFFFAVVTIYFLLPHRARWGLLLGASYYFYMCWKAEYLVLILFSTAVDFAAGLAIHASPRRAVRRMWLGFSLLSNLGLLFFFKYWNFFSDSARAVLDQLNILAPIPYFHLLLPVGISFYTFQSLSYTIDVYRDRIPPERHLGIFALYVAFFPQLVAGPIERATRLLPQFRNVQLFRYDRMADGLRLMFWGLFKKIVIADQMAPIVDAAYASPADTSGISLLFATYCFAFQIYCDFSGYSDIAIGAAKVMGFDLMKNFDRPYFAASFADFWRRWHISLSTWFRDYLYIPLGGSRVSHGRWIINLAAVFLISGLWHGANWTFVVWGGLHGVFLVAESELIRRNFLRPVEGLSKTGKVARITIVFHLVLFAWIFFRAASLREAMTIIQSIAIFAGTLIGSPLGITPYANIGSLPIEAPHAAILIAVLLLAMVVQSRGEIRGWLGRQHALIRWFVYTTGFVCVLKWGALAGQEFIYFAF